jgi:hypothetical protein
MFYKVTTARADGRDGNTPLYLLNRLAKIVLDFGDEATGLNSRATPVNVRLCQVPQPRQLCAAELTAALFRRPLLRPGLRQKEFVLCARAK